MRQVLYLILGCTEVKPCVITKSLLCKCDLLYRKSMLHTYCMKINYASYISGILQIIIIKCKHGRVADHHHICIQKNKSMKEASSLKRLIPLLLKSFVVCSIFINQIIKLIRIKPSVCITLSAFIFYCSRSVFIKVF